MYKTRVKSALQGAAASITLAIIEWTANAKPGAIAG
jgi:hypothetical protein